jgi:hypothetical protein
LASPAKAQITSKGTPATAAKPVLPRPADKPGLAAAKSGMSSAKSAGAASGPKKTVDKPALATAKPVTKTIALAKADPLAALPVKSKTRPH